MSGQKRAGMGKNKAEKYFSKDLLAAFYFFKFSPFCKWLEYIRSKFENRQDNW